MKVTDKLGLYKIEPNDDILDSIDKIGQNMDKIDEIYEEKINSISLGLKEGKNYPLAYKVWNNTPLIGGFIGWVNTRGGIYAKPWISSKSYSIGDKIFPTTNNGHYYECISGGTSNSVEPSFLTSSGVVVEDRRNTSSWNPTYNYNVGDLVVSTDGDTTFFYKCIVAGMTNSVEPNWVKTSGASTYDGSVVWVSIKTVKWKEMGSSCNFRPFGTIY